jgi:hypothetical protein
MTTFALRARLSEGHGQHIPRCPSPTGNVVHSKTTMTPPTFCGRTDIKDATLTRSRKMEKKSIDKGLCRLDVDGMVLVYKRDLSDPNGTWNAILTTGEVHYDDDTQEAYYINAGERSCKFMEGGTILPNYSLRPLKLC